jgi:hypothetical protein
VKTAIWKKMQIYGCRQRNKRGKGGKREERLRIRQGKERMDNGRQKFHDG